MLFEVDYNSWHQRHFITVPHLQICSILLGPIIAIYLDIIFWSHHPELNIFILQQQLGMGIFCQGNLFPFHLIPWITLLLIYDSRMLICKAARVFKDVSLILISNKWKVSLTTISFFELCMDKRTDIFFFSTFLPTVLDNFLIVLLIKSSSMFSRIFLFWIWLAQ